MKRRDVPAVLLLLLLAPSGSAQTACRRQTLAAEPRTLTLALRGNGLRLRESATGEFESRSILRCQSDVEVLRVPEAATAYEGVPLGGIVTVVETYQPLLDGVQIEQEALPACSGVFVSPTQILSSAHCAYHQRQSTDDDAYWMYGDGREQSTYLYAITGKVDSDDTTFTVYPLKQACIPQSYIDAVNEEATSSQGNDIVLFEISGTFQGARSAIATIGNSIAYNIPGDYMLPQYPSDVGRGERLVIDMDTTPIVFTPYQGGTFFSVDLASWSGSSGGPIIDVAASNANGSPVVLGVLMSSGWSLCDSGIVPVTSGLPLVQQLLTASRSGVGFAVTAAPPPPPPPPGQAPRPPPPSPGKDTTVVAESGEDSVSASVGSAPTGSMGLL